MTLLPAARPLTVASVLAVSGCGAASPKSNPGDRPESVGDAGGHADDPREPDTGEGQGDTGEAGEPPLPIALRVACPEEGLHFIVHSKDELGESAPASFFINPEDIDYAGSDPVFAKIDVAASSLPWTPPQTAQGSSWTEIVEGGDVLMFQSDFVASFTISVSLRAGDSEAPTPWTCEMQWHNPNRVWVELQSATGVTSDVQLHGLINQAEVDETDLYSPVDVTWCNTTWEGPTPETDADDVTYAALRDRFGAWMATMYGPAVVNTTVDLVATADDVTQWDDEDARLRAETEVRIYSFDTLLHAERVRFDNDATHHLGRIEADADSWTESAYVPVQAAMPSSDLSTCRD